MYLQISNIGDSNEDINTNSDSTPETLDELLIHYAHQGHDVNTVFGELRKKGIKFNEDNMRKHYRGTQSDARWAIPIFVILVVGIIGIIKMCGG